MSRLMYVPTHEMRDGDSSASSRATRASRSSTGTPTAPSTTNIQRMDRILKAEGDDPDHYKVAKQADAVMLFFLFSDDELRELFRRLGYDDIGRPDLARRTIDYYDTAPRTGRRCSWSRTPRSSPRSTRRARGSASWWRWRPTSATSRAARPRRVSTWG